MKAISMRFGSYNFSHIPRVPQAQSSRSTHATHVLQMRLNNTKSVGRLSAALAIGALVADLAGEVCQIGTALNPFPYDPLTNPLPTTSEASVRTTKASGSQAFTMDLSNGTSV